MPARTLTSSIDTGSSATRKRGVEHQGARQHHALQLAAAQLVRVAVEIALEVGQVDAAEGLRHAVGMLGLVDAGVEQRLGDARDRW